MSTCFGLSLCLEFRKLRTLYGYIYIFCAVSLVFARGYMIFLSNINNFEINLFTHLSVYLTDTSTPGQSGLEGNAKEGVL